MLFRSQRLASRPAGCTKLRIKPCCDSSHGPSLATSRPVGLQPCWRRRARCSSNSGAMRPASRLSRCRHAACLSEQLGCRSVRRPVPLAHLRHAMPGAGTDLSVGHAGLGHCRGLGARTRSTDDKTVIWWTNSGHGAAVTLTSAGSQSLPLPPPSTAWRARCSRNSPSSRP